MSSRRYLRLDCTAAVNGHNACAIEQKQTNRDERLVYGSVGIMLVFFPAERVPHLFAS